MKKYFYSSILVFAVLFVTNFSVSAQSGVLDPNQTIVDYNPDNPPSYPSQKNTIVPWVRSPKMGWNTDKYKAYFYSLYGNGGLPFRILFPTTYGSVPGKKYPMLVFFHGLGEISKTGPFDNELQLVNNGKVTMDRVTDGSFDGFVIFPQQITNKNGWESDLPQVEGLVNYMIDNGYVDQNRVIVTGLSMGGSAVWTFSHNYPKITAAAIPMSSAVPYYGGFWNTMESIPVWISQGGLDKSPLPADAYGVVSQLQSHGMEVNLFYYPNTGHGTWTAMFNEPTLWPFLMQANKTNPHVAFGTTEFCAGAPFSATLSLTGGFEDYEWSRNGVTISGANSSTLQVTDTGTYAARYKSNGEWTYWSPLPVKISYREITQTPSIHTSGLQSTVLPALDGKTSVTLAQAPGFGPYTWKNSSGLVVGTDSLYTTTQPGSYTVSLTDSSGCTALPSEPFVVASASGPNAPDPVTQFKAEADSKTGVQLHWIDNPNPVNNETEFELYRSEVAGSNYQIIAKIPADVLQYRDENLTPGKEYFYILRPVNMTGAAQATPELSISTIVDMEAPTAPGNLAITGADRTSIGLSWDQSTDDVAVDHYSVFANGTKLLDTEDNHVLLTGLNQKSSYVITVKAIDGVGNVSAASNQVVGYTEAVGLKYSYYPYTGAAWSKLPDFSALTPFQTGFTNNVNLSPAQQSENYALAFDGFINITSTGSYTFYTNSDDGSKLYINSILVVNNDGNHGMQEVSGTYSFSQTGYYPFRVEFYQGGGGQGLQVSWRKTGSNPIAKSLIPDSAFAGGPLPGYTLPATPTGLSATAFSPHSIRLTWVDGVNDRTGFEIYRSASASGPYQIINTVSKDSLAYNDTTVAPSTRYYYKVQAINQSGASGFDTQNPYASATTLDLPPAPGIPQSFSAQDVTKDRISLIWSAGGGNVEQYNLYRSYITGDNFVKIATLDAGTLNYSDSDLFGNVHYFYKLSAVNEGGESEPTSVLDLVTLNSAPVISAQSIYNVSYGQPSMVTITATDEDNDQLSFRSENFPVFAVLTDNGNNTAKIEFNPDESQKGSYPDVRVIVEDQHGGSDTASFEMAVSDFVVPVIVPVPAIEAQTFEVKSTTVTLQNPLPADNIEWDFINMPDFVRSRILPNGDLVLETNANSDDVGSHTFQIKVTTKDFGVSDVTTVNLNVTYKALQNWYLNMATSNSWMQYPSNPWNNIRSVQTDNLKDEAGNTTSVGFNLATSWWGTGYTAAMTGNNSGVYPDLVLRDYYYFAKDGGPQTVTGQITGLDPAKTYELTFFANSTWRFTKDNGYTVYQVGNRKDSIYVEGNTSRTVSISGIPDNNGTLGFTMSRGLGADAGYLNSLVIRTQPSMTPARPQNLVLTKESVDGANAIGMDWDLGSNNAKSIDIYRSTSKTGGYVLLNPDGNNGGDVRFVDTEIDPINGHTYWYYLVATNDFGSSIASDTVSVTTEKYVDTRQWYLNMATNNSWMQYPSAPWNNITGVAAENLTDDGGLPSSVGFKLQTTWWNTGYSTIVTGNNSGVYPDLVLRDYYYFAKDGGPQTVTGEITGLDPNKGYVLTFFANSAWRFTKDNGYTVYQVGSRKDSVYVESNTNNTVSIAGTPDNNGTLTFTMSRGLGADAGYLSSLIISTQASTAPEVPVDLIANKETVNGANAIALDWTLGSNNARTIEVYRSLSKTGTYTLLNQDADNGGDKHYLDTEIDPVNGHTYWYYVRAVNSSGTSVASDTVSLTTDQYTDVRKWYLNMATNNSWMQYPSAPWNNITGVTTEGLTDDGGLPSSVGFKLQTTWWNTGYSTIVTGNNSGVYPDLVLRDYYYFAKDGGPQTVTGEITGLDPNKGYVLTFFANSAWRFTKDNGYTVYQVGSRKDSVYVESNTTNTVSIAGTPDNNGTLTFTMSRGLGADAGYLSSLIISTQADTPPAVPVDLSASKETVNGGNAVALDWTSGSNNAKTIEVYRATVKSGPYTLLNQDEDNGGDSHYLDTEIDTQIGHTYWYYLVASNTYGRSVSSDTIAITTQDYIDARKWYLNMATSNSWMQYPSAPWNNITGVTTNDLLDDSGLPSSVGFKLQTTWWKTGYSTIVTGNNSGVYSDLVLRDYYYFAKDGGPETVTGQITGLNPDMSYQVIFFANSSWRFIGDNGNTDYQIGDQKVSLHVESNTSSTASIITTPDANGNITFTMARGDNAGAGYLTSMVISTLDIAAPSAPAQFEAVSDLTPGGNIARLSWQPASSNTGKVIVNRSEQKLSEDYTPIYTWDFDPQGGSLIDSSIDRFNRKSYYYYLVATNENGVSRSTDTIEVNTINVAPKAPDTFNLTDTIVGGVRGVFVGWSLPDYNGMDEIKVYRSESQQGTYTLLNGSVNGVGITGYLDTQVSIDHTYFYYLIAENQFGVSAPSDVISHKVSRELPESQIPQGVTLSTAVQDGLWAIRIKWDAIPGDIDRVQVFRKADSEDTYQLLNEYDSNGALTTYIDAPVSQATGYSYYLIAESSLGVSEPSQTVHIDIPNTVPPIPPVLSPINDINLGIGQSVTFGVQINPTSANVNFGLVGAPAFVKLENLGNNQAEVIITPDNNDLGYYQDIAVLASDDDGNTDITYFSVKITDGHISDKILLNFTNGDNLYSFPWNNVPYSNSGNNTISLIDGYGQPLSSTLTVVNTWTGVRTDGSYASDNSGAVPDGVMKTGFYLNNNTTRTLLFSNLNAGKRYNFMFFASANDGISSNYLTNYTIGSQSVSLNGYSNIHNTVRINGVAPQSDGSIILTVTKDQTASLGLLNAIEIEEYDADELIAPANLTASAKSGGVDLKWDDRSGNEVNFQVLRSDKLEGTYTLIDLAGADVTAFTDVNVSADTRYFYKVVAVDDENNTAESNVASATTPEELMYVNFNLKEDPAPTPWYNTDTPPQEGDVYGPITNADGNNTGITIVMGANFEGENPVGYTTGNNSGLYPDLVMQSAYYMDNGFDTVVMNISNLDLTRVYDFTFYGSIVGFGLTNTTQYISGNQIMSLETSNNQNKTVTLRDLKPDENGVIVIKVINTPESDFAVLNAMIIQKHHAFDDEGNIVMDPIAQQRKMSDVTNGINTEGTLNKNLQTAVDSHANNDRDLSGQVSFEVVRVYPNPFSQFFDIELSSSQSGKVELSFYSINGQFVDKKVVSVYQGTNKIRYQPHGILKAGTYIISLRSIESDKTISRKVIKIDR